MHECQECCRRLVVASCDSPESFDVVEEALDAIAQSIQFLVMPALFDSALARRNHSFDFSVSKLLKDLVGIVCTVGKACSSNNVVDERFRYG